MVRPSQMGRMPVLTTGNVTTRYGNLTFYLSLTQNPCLTTLLKPNRKALEALTKRHQLEFR
jgi:hypothetical protein